MVSERMQTLRARVTYVWVGLSQDRQRTGGSRLELPRTHPILWREEASTPDAPDSSGWRLPWQLIEGLI